MKILYTHNSPCDDGADVGADKVYADTKETRRSERSDLLVASGLRGVDALYLRAWSALGHGAEAKLMRGKVEAIGCDVIIAPLPDKPKEAPAVHWRPSAEVKSRVLILWWSARPTKQVLARISDIAGRKVSRDQMYRLGGPRDGSQALTKKPITQ